MKAIVKSLMMILTISLIASACSTTKIMTDVNQTSDFNKVKTYQVVFEEPTDHSVYINDLNNKRIEKALDIELKNRGLEKVNNNADVQLHILLGVEETKSYSANTTHMGDPFMGRRYRGTGMGYSTTTMNEYTTNIGNFTITMRDAKSGELMWYVTAEKELKSKKKNQQEKVNEGVAKLLEDFPIAPKQ